MILTRLTAIGTDGSQVFLWLDDGTKLRAPTSLVVEKGLYGGMELEEEALSALMEEIHRASARSRALRIVSATSISEKNLRQRLVQRGEEPQHAQEAVDYLRELGALDDQALSRQVVERCVGKGYGKARIRRELQEKGVPREYWEAALETVPDMSGAIDRFLARRFRGEPPDQKELRRAADALYRRGHSWEDISAALRRYEEQLEDYNT